MTTTEAPAAWLLPTLPYPPSVNQYWRRVGNKTILSAKARQYRLDVEAVMRASGVVEGFAEDIAVTITFYPPDNRRRDLDNLPKGLLDALCHAGIYLDDSQVRRLDLRFGEVRPGGESIVSIRPI